MNVGKSVLHSDSVSLTSPSSLTPRPALLILPHLFQEVLIVAPGTSVKSSGPILVLILGLFTVRGPALFSC